MDTRKYYLLTISFLVLLLALWMDEVFIKTNPSILTYKYQIGKILIHTTGAYMLSKYVTKKILKVNNLMSSKPKFLFLGIFLLFNSYIIIQFISRTVSSKIINYETRKLLENKIIKTEHSGRGYVANQLTINEYEEINKSSNLLDLPKEAKDIYVFDWFGFQDFSRIVEFTVNPNFDKNQFFKDSSILNHLKLLKVKYDEERNILINVDTIKSKRYIWEVGEM